METSFPKNEGTQFIQAKDFQDNETILTFQGWDRVPNEDLTKDGKVIKAWKDRLQYQLRYTFPEWAIDPATGEKRTNKSGEPFRNKYYMVDYPKGYTIKYIFAEGTLECGSLPLFEEFKKCQPKVGEKIAITRTGKDKETVWEVARIRKDGLKEIPDEVVFQDEPVGEDTSTPF